MLFHDDSELVVSWPPDSVTAPSARIDSGPSKSETVSGAPLAAEREPNESMASGKPYPPLLSAPAGWSVTWATSVRDTAAAGTVVVPTDVVGVDPSPRA